MTVFLFSETEAVSGVFTIVTSILPIFLFNIRKAVLLFRLSSGLVVVLVLGETLLESGALGAEGSRVMTVRRSTILSLRILISRSLQT